MTNKILSDPLKLLESVQTQSQPDEFQNSNSQSIVRHELKAHPQQERDPINITEQLDFFRLEINRRLDPKLRVSLGQFLTPASIARLMASMLNVHQGQEITLLDPGAGIGTLFTGFVEACCRNKVRPQKIHVTAYEIDPIFKDYLYEATILCDAACQACGIEFKADILQEDFIEAAASMLSPNLFLSKPRTFTHAILNPPYHKIQTNSKTRKLLRRSGIETSNIYTGFVALTSMLLEQNGHMVSITPRSFCNGPYFKPFRQLFLKKMQIERLHLFHSRSQVFHEDDVLQENVIMSARKGGASTDKVLISSSYDPEDEIEVREVDPSEIVFPEDNDSIIHIITSEFDSRIAKLASRLTETLESLGLQVSTGRVVDFRTEKYIVDEPTENTAPLIYPIHFHSGYIKWPVNGGRKPNAIIITSETRGMLLPNENYVIVKRFSAKEERKRVVAAVYEANYVNNKYVAFENHLNYIHHKNRGLDIIIARGIATYLNSTVVDTLFRHFSGHTQVNASDLQKMPYPNLKEIEAIGRYINKDFPSQAEIDRIVEKEIFDMTTLDSEQNPFAVKNKIQEALVILKALGLPRAQQNERSALTLLALLNLKPSATWQEASDPLMGITPMMDYFSKHYGKRYAPNTRETVRRQTVHQFLQAGIIVENPDEPSRPTNSPKAVYQIEVSTLELLRTYGTKSWDSNLRTYLASVKTLVQRYAREREMNRIPIQLKEGKTIYLTPGGQNILIEHIIKEFGSRFTPGGMLAYVGDTGEKFAYFDEELLKNLNISIESHGKMPDIIIYYKAKNWLILFEAVTSHGPVDPKRRDELKRLFKDCSAGLVFVTAFLTRRAMVEYLNDISWETEVWVAESPSHIIHFNGERFLGPYEL